MNVAEARQPRHALIQTWIVLHGAGAEREQTGVDAVVPLAQAHVVPHRYRLGERWLTQRRAPGELAEAGSKARWLLEVDTRGLDTADFKDQTFLDGQRAVAAEGVGRARNSLPRRRRPALSIQHSSTSRSALA